MVDEYKIPTLREALKETEKELTPEPKEKLVIPDPKAPSPPRDWISHPITQVIGFLILIAVTAVLWFRLPEWLKEVESHLWQFGVTIFLVIIAILLIAARSWFARQAGDWDSKMTKITSKEKEEK